MRSPGSKQARSCDRACWACEGVESTRQMRLAGGSRNVLADRLHLGHDPDDGQAERDQPPSRVVVDDRPDNAVTERFDGDGTKQDERTRDHHCGTRSRGSARIVAKSRRRKAL